MSACNAVTRSGIPCRFPARRGAAFCLNHDPLADLTAAATRAAHISALARRRPSEQLLDATLSLTDRASIQAVLDALIRLQFAGRISHERAHIILRACAIAVRNFDRPADTLSGPTPQQHDWALYFDKVQALLATVDPLLEEAGHVDALAPGDPP